MFTDTDAYAEMHLSPIYCERHFPVGILLQEVNAALRDSRAIRRRAIVVLRNLLAKHTFDARYDDLVGVFFSAHLCQKVSFAVVSGALSDALLARHRHRARVRL